MRPRALWGDLLLVLDLVLHPVRQWRSWRSLTAGLLGDGGATITTSSAAEVKTVVARTVIQPDGDVLVMVDPGFLHADVLLAQHGRQVAEWFDRSRASMRQATLTLQALSLGASGGAGAESWWSVYSRVHGIGGGVLGLAASGAIAPLVHMLFGRLASAVVRHRVDRWLGGAGAKA